MRRRGFNGLATFEIDILIGVVNLPSMRVEVFKRADKKLKESQRIPKRKQIGNLEDAGKIGFSLKGS